MNHNTLKIVIAGVMLGACGQEDIDPEDLATTTEDALRSPLIDRVIPLRAYLLNHTSDRSTHGLADDSEIEEAIRTANQTFFAAGVQFELAGVTVIASSLLADHDYTRQYSWPEVRSELQKIAPAATFPDHYRCHIGQWLNAVAIFLPKNEIPLFIARNQHFAANASMPWWDTTPPGAPWSQDWSNSLRFNEWDISALAHELGHYLGLTHTWEVASGLDPNHDAAYFYDLVYAAEGNGVRVFTSEADARSVASSRLQPKDYASCGPPADSACTLTCTLNGRSYSTTYDFDVLRGLAFRYKYGPNGVNLMSYLFGPAPCNAGISGSQIRRVRETLRSTRGGRHLLGSYNARNATNPYSGTGWNGVLDFDGDGTRDIAVFRPEIGQCLVKRSSDGGQTAISLPFDASLGDTPIPADFDNDGRTDCALFRPGHVGGDWHAYWIWRKSSTSELVVDTFGTIGDVPLPGLNFIAGSGEYAVYRPAEARFFWARAPGGDSATIYSKQYGTQGDVLLPGLYDMDGLTDIGVFRPGQAIFSLTTSESGYTDSRDFWTASSGFATQYGWNGTASDMPMRGVDKNGDGRTDFALYRANGGGWPNDGMWLYILNPGASNPRGAVQQWGAAEDIPFSGFDFDWDGKADEVVYRPSNSLTTPGTFHVLRSYHGAKSIPFGRDELVPFVITDRDGDRLPEFITYEPNYGSWSEMRSAWGTWPSYFWFDYGLYTDIPL